MGNDARPPGQDVVVDVSDLELESRLPGGLPIVNVFYDRLGIDRLLERYVPGDASHQCGCVTQHASRGC